MYLPRISFLIAGLIAASPVHGHEFWLEARQYQVAPGENITVNLRNGEHFEGRTLAYFDRSTTRFGLSFGGEITQIEARSGDVPALDIPAPADDGLLGVVHEAAPSSVTYDDWEKFVSFAEHKDFDTVIEAHIAAGFPRDRFKESYTRHSKALIAVGTGEGSDQPLGLETEITALSNPYAADFDGVMRVSLSYQGVPREAAQIEVYARAKTSEVTIRKYTTDAAGLAQFPVERGITYLVDAVLLRPAPEAGAEPGAPLWETLWASLTFAVPR
ncbi:DUF4198 domain-containing protein [Sulfitobacter aestuarii]|uniref:DUF4198 domain-containing protein n=1 Tax=Sulfitobacter aestuarii TaxID=2161676 RepID=A0ABW5U130_9RHOB